MQSYHATVSQSSGAQQINPGSDTALDDAQVRQQYFYYDE